MNHKSVECRHCGKVTGTSPGRCLCWACYRDRGVRLRYRRLKQGPNGHGAFAPADDQEWRKAGRRAVESLFADDGGQPGDPTPEEVAAFAEWWAAECEAMDESRRCSVKVYRIVKCE